MIIKTFQIKNLTNSTSSFFLLYGENEGFKNQIINNNLLKMFNENILRYEENEILKDKNIFYDEIKSKSFFDNKKTIIISRSSDKILNVIENFLDEKFEDTRIIINSGPLEKKSKLRNKFEKASNLVCIPFYADDNITLNRIALNFFKDKKLSVSQENINLISERCKGDRENLNNELLKIESFTKNKKKISTNEILRLTNLADNYTYNELSDHCLNKNLKKIINIINENNYNSDDCVAITRVLLSKVKRLIKLKEDNILEKNIDNVVSNHKPPIFWKDKDLVKSQMKIWSLEKAKELLYGISEIELIIKKGKNNPINILYNFILTQARPSN